MSTKKNILKVLIILILAVFLLSTGLISVLYLGGKNPTTGTGDILSGDVAVETGLIATGLVATGLVATGTD